MDSKATITEEEAENAEQAFLEFQESGKTDRHCLRCGGQLRFEDFKSAFRVTCLNCDFIMTVRGI